MHPIGYASRNCDMRAIYRVFVRPGTLVFTAQTCLEYSNPNKKIEKCSQDAISSLMFTSTTCNCTWITSYVPCRPKYFNISDLALLSWLVVQCAHLEKWWSESQWEGLYIPYMMENKNPCWDVNQCVACQRAFYDEAWPTTDEPWGHRQRPNCHSSASHCRAMARDPLPECFYRGNEQNSWLFSGL